MIYELRTYTIAEGRMADCHRIFKETVIPLFQEFGMTTVGFWEPLEGDGTSFIYMLGFADAAAREAAWAAFVAHANWLALKKEMGDSPPWTKAESQLLDPTGYSPLS